MIEALKQFVNIVLDNCAELGLHRAPPNRAVDAIADPISGFQEIAKVFNSLDFRDFNPSAQTEFLRVRANINQIVNFPNSSYREQHFRDRLGPALAVLDKYEGLGSHGSTRSFVFVADADLRAIIERDYAELRIRVFPSGAWKCSVVLAGSILEALLIDRLADPKWNSSALTSSKAPRKSGAVLPLDDWKLEKLIDVAQDIVALPEDRARTIHQVLRDYRNFVHPKKEIRSKYACTEAEAMMSIGALDGVCNYLEANP